MKKYKTYLHPFNDMSDLSMIEVNAMYHEHVFRRDYDFFRKVQPGDIVVDVGACVGLFTLRALELGASKVFAIEPNKKYLRTLMANTTDHAVDNKGSSVVPIHAVIGESSRAKINVYGDDDSAPILSFKDMIEKYNIDHIDYLKIDCEGGEYDIFIKENIDFLKNNVTHMAIEFHLNCFREAPYEFLEFRDNFVYNFENKDMNFMTPHIRNMVYDDNWIHGQWPIWNGAFMVYLTNNS